MKKNKWIKDCWDYHSKHIDDHDVAVEWDFWDEDQSKCWCCGRKTSHLQKCHLVPKSLGGTFEPSNIVPLCGQCHDDAPDVYDRKVMIGWIKDQQNPGSKFGLGRYWHLWDKLVPLATEIYEKYGEIDQEELKDIIRDNYEKTSVHGGQTRQGIYWKNSTREWVIERSFKDYQLNREAEEWED